MAEPQNPERLLKVENLDVGYGATRVVWDVSLEVDRRQVVSLIGPNGAGKTTLLKALAGLLPVICGSDQCSVQFFINDSDIVIRKPC